jgi:cell division septum initiation protein DivIVA
MVSKKLIETHQELQKELKELQRQEKELRALIIQELGEKSQESIGDYIVKLSRYERESFSLKKALEKLDKRVLKPFITVSEAVRLTIKKAA